MATIMRFVILGDDRGGPAFAQFRREVERSNRAVDRNNASLRRQAGAARAAQGGVAALAGTVSGFGSAFEVANSRGSMFARVLAGINIATGVLEPVMAGLVAGAAGLAAGFTSAAIGAGVFGAVAASAVSSAAEAAKKAGTAQTAYQAAVAGANAKYRAQMAAATTQAQRQAAVTARQSALQSALAARVRATTKAYAGMSPAQVQLAGSIQRAKDQWEGFVKRATPGVAAVMGKAFGLLPLALKAMQPFLGPVETALSLIINNLRQAMTSPFWRRFIQQMSGYAGPMLEGLATAAGHLAHGLAGVLLAFQPLALRMVGGLDALTARFARWGETLTRHSGFQSLMAMFRSQTPMAMQVLRNLATIIGNVARATVGLASPANSKALLNILTPLTQIMVRLSANQGLVRAVLYFMLLRKALGQVQGAAQSVFGPQGMIASIGGVVKTIRNVVFWAGRMRDGFISSAAAESAYSGVAGTLGGKLRVVWDVVAGATKAAWKSVAGWVAATAAMVAHRAAAIAGAVATAAMTAAQWALNIAMRANPYVIAITALVALGTALYMAWTRSATFRKIVIGAFTAVKITTMAVLRWFTGPFLSFWRNLPGRIAGAVGGLGKLLYSRGRALVAGLWSGIRAVWAGARAWLAALGLFTLRAVGATGGWLYTRGRGVISGLWNGIRNVWAGARGWLAGLGGAVARAVGATGWWLWRQGRGILNGLWNGIKSVWRSVVGWFKGLPSKILHALGIASPPPWSVSAGKHIMNGILKGLAHGAANVGGFFRHLATDVGGVFSKIWSWLTGGGGGKAGPGAASAMRFAQSVLGYYGWGPGQWPALRALWMGESGWRWNARNPSSGAYGIPQALPASKMAAAGRDWLTNAATQIRWGLRYIAEVYGSPVRAYAAWLARSPHWYQRGAWRVAETGPGIVHRGEMILPEQIAEAVRRAFGRGPRGGGPLIGQAVITEAADVDLLARRLAFALDL